MLTCLPTSSSSLSIRPVEQNARPLRLVASGSVDVMTADELEIRLLDEIRERGDVLLDLSRVSFMDTCGIRVVVRALKLAKANGWGFAIGSDVPPQVRRLFRETGLEPFLPLVAA